MMQRLLLKVFVFVFKTMLSSYQLLKYYCQRICTRKNYKESLRYLRRILKLKTKNRRMEEEDPRIHIWEKKQHEIRQQVIVHDTETWQKLQLLAGDDFQNIDENAVRYVAGMDISHVKSSESVACTALVVCELPSLKVVYKNCEWVELTAPYIPGFLTFREADFLIEIYQKLISSNVEYIPQVVLVDGNGVLHSRRISIGCGLACHIGVNLNIPTIGVAKNLYHVDGLAKDKQHKEKIQSLMSKGDVFPLVGDSGRTLGVALKSSEKADKPIYVSVGHKISLETAAWLVTKCSLYRIPEPIRQADHLSRELVRLTFPDDAS